MHSGRRGNSTRRSTRSQTQQEEGDEEDEGEDGEGEGGPKEQEATAAVRTDELNTHHPAPRVDWSVFAADEVPAPPARWGSASVSLSGYGFGSLQ